MTVLERLARRAAAPSSPWSIGALALLLSLPSLAGGLALDDHVLAQAVADGAPWWDLFSFMEPQRVPAAMERGFMGWWTDPQLQLHFFRPIASLTHALDYRLWPGAPWLMHLVSVLVYAGLVVVAGHLYRRWLGATAVAGLAALLFAIDETHAQSIGWLASRNTLLATGLGLGCLWAHERWRDEGWKPGAVLGPLLLALALLAAEGALAMGGYLVARAVCLERGPWRRRLGALLPYAAVVVAWRLAYVDAGYGARASGMYRDIGSDPLGFVAAMGPTACVLGFAQLTLPVATFLGPSSHGWRLAALGLLALAWLCWPLLRHDRQARFFALGMILASAPFAATLPTDRMLLPLGLGGAGLVARLLAVARARILPQRRVRPLAHLMAVLHLGLAPLLFVPFLLSTAVVEGGARQLADTIPDHPVVVVVNVPFEILLLYPQAFREGRGEGRGEGRDEGRGDRWPEHVMPLHAGQTELRVERTGPASLELFARAGWMPSPLNRLTRAAGRPIPVGTRVPLQTLTIEVLEVNGSGRPTRVAARFDRPLEAVAWVAWVDGHAVQWQPPPIGEPVALSARWEW